MKKTLVLAEKPSVGRDIARVLECKNDKNGYIEGSKYIVTWALGHLVTLADPESYDQKYKAWNIDELPILPKHLKTVVIKKTSKQFNIVKSQINRDDVGKIVIATDAGREGELVARWILQKCNTNKPLKRLWISSSTDKAIKDGFKNLKEASKYENLYNSAIARAEADWIVGINATRALTTKFNAQLSCGRVQTPTLAMIHKREEEIRNFTPREYYTLEVKTKISNEIVKFTWQDKKNLTSTFSKDKIDNIYNKIKNNLNDAQFITVDYIRKCKRIPNTRNPKTFSEKIHFIKISDWLEDKSDFVDKYKVREFIKNEIGEEYLIKLLGVYDNVEQIEFDKLPQSFVLKLNNGSGYNLIVKNKDDINELQTRELLNEWLKSDFYKVSREKQYKNVKQLLICEEYLEDDSGELRDYKFFCFDGKFKFVQVDSGRFSEHIQNFYDNKWNKLDFTYVCEKNDIIDIKPEKYEEMITLAEKLSSQFPFVRVDFYYINNKIYFGELTFTPNNGMESIKPIERDTEIAGWIDIKKYK